MSDKQDESNDQGLSLDEKMIDRLKYAVKTAPNSETREQAQQELDKLIKQNKQ
jgi:hypothetical protein